MTRFLFGLLAGVILADTTHPAGSDLSDWLQGRPPAIECSTDSECMELCPSDDPDCDGGPEPAVEPKRLPLACWAAKSHIRCEVL